MPAKNGFSAGDSQNIERPAAATAHGLGTGHRHVRSTSGRSSRSTLMETKCSFRTFAVSSFSNDSRSMTWHQWQVE